MARKHKHPEHVNHERWLVSYADFITLLFAFFVVMFAVSQVDSKKLGRFTESFKEATEWQVFNQGGQGLLPGGQDSKAVGEPKVGSTVMGLAAEAQEFSDQKKSIRRALAQRATVTPSLAGLRLVDARDELVLRLPERLLFDRAEAALHEEGRQALLAIVDELAPRAVRIRIEGHTDSTPIHTAKFPSNWELSMARAMTCVGVMLDAKKIPPERLAAAGYSEHHPVASNDTVEGKAQNRRVDVVVIAQPQAGPPPVASQSISETHEASPSTATSASPSPALAASAVRPSGSAAPEGAGSRSPSSHDKAAHGVETRP
jgi:chemotaxis protein MotB